MKKLMVLALVLSLVGLASATSITVVNSSFELDASGNQIAGGVADITTGSLGWNEVYSGGDWYPHVSFQNPVVSVPTGGAYLMLKHKASPPVFNESSKVWQIIDGQTISAGEIYTISFRSAQHEAGAVGHGRASLVYEDGNGDAVIISSSAEFVPVVGQDTVDGSGWETFSFDFSIEEGADCIGKNVGIQFNEYYAQWLAVDDVVLSVVPEPATMLILGLGGLFLRRRK